MTALAAALRTAARLVRDAAAGRDGDAAAIARPLLEAGEIARLAAQASHWQRRSARREVHDHHAGDWPSAWLGRGLDFEEARAYTPGDDVRDMDWRTTARLGHPFVKIYREERLAQLHLVVDRGPTMRFGTRRRLKVAQAARIAIVAGFAAALENVAVGATLWDRHDAEFPASHGRGAMLQLVQAFVAPCPPQPADAGGAQRDLQRLRVLAAELPRGSRVLLLSDLHWLGAAHQPALARLADRRDVLAIRIADPAELALPDVGLARFLDLSRGGECWIDTGDAAARGAYAAAAGERRAAVEAILGRCGVRWLDVSTDADDLLALPPGDG